MKLFTLISMVVFLSVGATTSGARAGDPNDAPIEDLDALIKRNTEMYQAAQKAFQDSKKNTKWDVLDFSRENLKAIEKKWKAKRDEYLKLYGEHLEDQKIKQEANKLDVAAGKKSSLAILEGDDPEAKKLDHLKKEVDALNEQRVDIQSDLNHSEEVLKKHSPDVVKYHARMDKLQKLLTSLKAAKNGPQKAAATGAASGAEKVSDKELEAQKAKAKDLATLAQEYARLYTSCIHGDKKFSSTATKAKYQEMLRTYGTARPEGPKGNTGENRSSGDANGQGVIKSEPDSPWN